MSRSRLLPRTLLVGSSSFREDRGLTCCSTDTLIPPRLLQSVCCAPIARRSSCRASVQLSKTPHCTSKRCFKPSSTAPCSPTAKLKDFATFGGAAYCQIREGDRSLMAVQSQVSRVSESCIRGRLLTPLTRAAILPQRPLFVRSCSPSSFATLLPHHSGFSLLQGSLCSPSRRAGLSRPPSSRRYPTRHVHHLCRSSSSSPKRRRHWRILRGSSDGQRVNRYSSSYSPSCPHREAGAIRSSVQLPSASFQLSSSSIVLQEFKLTFFHL